ncbi:hypothetical protein ACFL6A_01050 [bacterium]
MKIAQKIRLIFIFLFCFCDNYSPSPEIGTLVIQISLPASRNFPVLRRPKQAIDKLSILVNSASAGTVVYENIDFPEPQEIRSYPVVARSDYTVKVFGYSVDTRIYVGIEEDVSVKVNQSTTVDINLLYQMVQLKMNPEEIFLWQGETQQFRAWAIFPDDEEIEVTEKVSWEVNPGNAGSIDQNGLFTASNAVSGTEIVTADYQSHRISTMVNVYGEDVVFLKTFGGEGDDSGQGLLHMGYLYEQIDGFAIVGYTTIPESGNVDAILIRTDKDGKILKQWTYDLSYNDRFLSINRWSNIGYAVGGVTHQNGSPDAWILSIDGGHLYSKTISGGAASEAAFSVQRKYETASVAVGYTQSFGAGNRDVYLVKTADRGEEVWVRTFGGAFNDVGYCIQKPMDRSIIIGGYTESTIGNKDMLLIKTDYEANIDFQTSYGGEGDEIAYYVVQVMEGGYLLVGTTTTFGSGNEDLWLVKTDSQGNEEWNRTYGGAGCDVGVRILNSWDGYIIAGYTDSFGNGGFDAWLLLLDTNGGVLWERTMGGSGDDYAYDVAATPGGGYAFTGKTNSFGSGGLDIWLVKILP